jgi:hypothetical protein
MHRVELKAFLPNELLDDHISLFLMHRVELKVIIFCPVSFSQVFLRFLMHRVELKGLRKSEIEKRS